jgi:protocatechuate 3,4-dioxygenase alpha subunit
MEKKFKQTPSQTIGPFFAYGLTPEQYSYDFADLADNYLYKKGKATGERITIKGQIFDGAGELVDDAMIEIRQDATLDGFGRYGTGTEVGNQFTFHTLKPTAKNGNAPFINVVIMMRGLLNNVFTRIYFSDEATANATDKVLNLVPKERQQTLIAQHSEQNGQIIYTFNIYMQGENETVFFDT